MDNIVINLTFNQDSASPKLGIHEYPGFKCPSITPSQLKAELPYQRTELASQTAPASDDATLIQDAAAEPKITITMPS